MPPSPQLTPPWLRNKVQPLEGVFVNFLEQPIYISPISMIDISRNAWILYSLKGTKSFVAGTPPQTPLNYSAPQTAISPSCDGLGWWIGDTPTRFNMVVHPESSSSCYESDWIDDYWFSRDSPIVWFRDIGGHNHPIKHSRRNLTNWIRSNGARHSQQHQQHRSDLHAQHTWMALSILHDKNVKLRISSYNALSCTY